MKQEESGITFTLSLQQFQVPLVGYDLFPQKTIGKLFLALHQRIEPVGFFRISIRPVDQKHKFVITQMIVNRPDKPDRLHEFFKIFRSHLFLYG